MLEKGFYAAPRGYVTVSLPITESDKEDFVNAVGEFISTMADHLGPALA